MTKGRPATTGIDHAVRIARERGCTMKICYGLENVCDLVIRTATHVIFIKARRTEKIVSALHEIESAYRDLIDELRLFPTSAQILLELWVYSKHGTFRFFRVGETGISEIDRVGAPVDSAGPDHILEKKKT